MLLEHSIISSSFHPISVRRGISKYHFTGENQDFPHIQQCHMHFYFIGFFGYLN